MKRQNYSGSLVTPGSGVGGRGGGGLFSRLGGKVKTEVHHFAQSSGGDQSSGQSPSVQGTPGQISYDCKITSWQVCNSAKTHWPVYHVQVTRTEHPLSVVENQQEEGSQVEELAPSTSGRRRDYSSHLSTTSMHTAQSDRISLPSSHPSTVPSSALNNRTRESSRRESSRQGVSAFGGGGPIHNLSTASPTASNTTTADQRSPVRGPTLSSTGVYSDILPGGSFGTAATSATGGGLQQVIGARSITSPCGGSPMAPGGVTGATPVIATAGGAGGGLDIVGTHTTSTGGFTTQNNLNIPAMGNATAGSSTGGGTTRTMSHLHAQQRATSSEVEAQFSRTSDDGGLLSGMLGALSDHPAAGGTTPTLQSARPSPLLRNDQPPSIHVLGTSKSSWQPIGPPSTSLHEIGEVGDNNHLHHHRHSNRVPPDAASCGEQLPRKTSHDPVLMNHAMLNTNDFGVDVLPKGLPAAPGGGGGHYSTCISSGGGSKIILDKPPNLTASSPILEHSDTPNIFEPSGGSPVRTGETLASYGMLHQILNDNGRDGMVLVDHFVDAAPESYGTTTNHHVGPAPSPVTIGHRSDKDTSITCVGGRPLEGIATHGDHLHQGSSLRPPDCHTNGEEKNYHTTISPLLHGSSAGSFDTLLSVGGGGFQTNSNTRPPLFTHPDNRLLAGTTVDNNSAPNNNLIMGGDSQQQQQQVITATLTPTSAGSSNKFFLTAQAQAPTSSSSGKQQQQQQHNYINSVHATPQHGGVAHQSKTTQSMDTVSTAARTGSAYQTSTSFGGSLAKEPVFLSPVLSSAQAAGVDNGNNIQDEDEISGVSSPSRERGGDLIKKTTWRVERSDEEFIQLWAQLGMDGPKRRKPIKDLDMIFLESWCRVLEDQLNLALHNAQSTHFPLYNTSNAPSSVGNTLLNNPNHANLAKLLEWLSEK